MNEPRQFKVDVERDCPRGGAAPRLVCMALIDGYLSEAVFPNLESVEALAGGGTLSSADRLKCERILRDGGRTIIDLHATAERLYHFGFARTF